MADRYPKDDILAIPLLQPERHYESEGVVPKELPQEPSKKQDRLLETLDDLDRVYRMADFLPPELAKLIKPIADELSKHTQGLIILRLKEKMKPRPSEPEPVTPPPENIVPEPWIPPTTPDSRPIPVKPPPPVTPSEPFPHYGPSPGPDDFKPKDYIETWPGNEYVYDEGQSGEDEAEVISTGDDNGDEYEVIITDNKKTDGEEAEITDIFSSEPIFTVTVQPSESLVDLARKGYLQDDCDIKEHFTSRMTQLTHRFFQVMTAIAEDCGLLDYTDLMMDFDGTAVVTDDPDQRHLIDSISKSQVIYDQKLRQMNLLNTAENTLIYQRNMTAAEGQRERYLGEKYKNHMPTVSSSFSNDLLLQSRDNAEKRYKDSAYNMYKYLDSATKFTNTLLNMKIDQASAKAQLINTGSDIFAQTPPPQPQPDEVDNNFQTTKDHQTKVQEAIDKQKTDSKTGKEVNSSSSFGGGSYDGKMVAASANAESIFKALRACGYNDIVACGIMGNLQQESGLRPEARNPYGYEGIAQWDPGKRWPDCVAFCQAHAKDPYDVGAQISFLYYEACNIRYPDECNPQAMNSKCSDVATAVHEWVKWYEGAVNADGTFQQEGERNAYAAQFYERFKGQ